jgi:RNA polymerase sigma-70 factor (sigma-E family)
MVNRGGVPEVASDFAVAPRSLDRAQGGPAPRSLTALYERHASQLARLAYLITGDPEVAEDLCQEAFARAFVRLVHLRRAEASHAYLRRTVINLALKQRQRAKREREHLSELARLPGESFTDPDIALREQLWTALQRLPHRQRAALVLRFYEDLSEREIARILGCRRGTVKSLVHRALIGMRTEMEDPRDE